MFSMALSSSPSFSALVLMDIMACLFNLCSMCITFRHVGHGVDVGVAVSVPFPDVNPSEDLCAHLLGAPRYGAVVWHGPSRLFAGVLPDGGVGHDVLDLSGREAFREFGDYLSDKSVTRASFVHGPLGLSR